MIFKRSLRRELNNTAGAVFTTLFSITLSVMLIQNLKQAASGSVDSTDIVALIGFTSLMNMHILLILTGFISVLLVLTRSYQDSEMVVWFASGLSLRRWIVPVLQFGLPLIILTGLLSFVVTPWAYKQSEEYRERFQKRSDISKVTPGKFQESSSADRIFFVEEVAGDLSRVQNIFIKTREGNVSSVVVAKEGSFELDKNGDKFLVMSNGSRYDGLPTDPDFQMMQFEKYGVLVHADGAKVKGTQSVKAMPLMTLLDHPGDHAEGELLWRISLPLLGFCLILLAIPLSYVNPRVGRSANLIVALLMVVIYLNVINSLQYLVEQGRLEFSFAWWPAHALTLLVCGLMFYWRTFTNHLWHPNVALARLRRCITHRKAT